MKENLLKKMAKAFYYKPGSVHRVLAGPMRGMVFRVNDVAGLSPAYSGRERLQQRKFAELLKRGSVMIDVGASWGLHTIFTSRLVGDTGRVVAIEPFPRGFEELEWHVRANGCANVTLMNTAIADTDGRVELSSPPDGPQGVLADLVDDRLKSSFSEKCVVHSKRLDTVADELGLERVDLVKIDTEGAEPKVLIGAEKVTARFRPYFILDPHNPANDRFVGRWFTGHGYTLARLDASLPPILKTDTGWPDENGVWGSILAIPQKRRSI